MTTEEKVREVVVFYDLCRLTTDEATSKLMSIIDGEKKQSYIKGSNDNFKIMMDKDYCDKCLCCNGNMKPILYGYCDHCAKDFINTQTKAAR